MKRFTLTLLFCLSYLFFPFIFAKCGGEDKPYIKTTDAKPDCTDAEFLTADCVDPTTPKTLQATDTSVDDEETADDGDNEDSDDQ